MVASSYNVYQLRSVELDKYKSVEISELMCQLSGRDKSISVSDLKKVSDNNFVVCASHADNNSIIGMAVLVKIDLPQGQRMLVESVIVHDKHRRQGVGRALIRALVEEARKAGDSHLSLTCNPRRPEAHKLYRELGFKAADTAVLRLSL